MISFPCDVYEMSLSSIFTDDYGPYNKEKWRLLFYHPENDSTLYIEYRFMKIFTYTLEWLSG